MTGDWGADAVTITAGISALSGLLTAVRPYLRFPARRRTDRRARASEQGPATEADPAGSDPPTARPLVQVVVVLLPAGTSIGGTPPGPENRP